MTLIYDVNFKILKNLHECENYKFENFIESSVFFFIENEIGHFPILGKRESYNFGENQLFKPVLLIYHFISDTSSDFVEVVGLLLLSCSPVEMKTRYVKSGRVRPLKYLFS